MKAELSQEIQVLLEVTLATCTPPASPRWPGINEGGVPHCGRVPKSTATVARPSR